jgi:hypothetical protein
MTRLTYNRDAIERALDIHRKAGRIGQWFANPERDGHTVVLNDFAPVTTRSLRETQILVFGLASAGKARTPTFLVALPYSEVCMHMRIAGQTRMVQALPHDMAQILNDDGSPLSFPITWGEAGIHRDNGRPYVAESARPQGVSS